MGDAILKRMDQEVWLCGKLKARGMSVFQGDTTFELRRQRVREAINEAGLADTNVGRGKDGRQRTYREAFEQVYGEAL